MKKWVAAPFLAKIEKITALGSTFSPKIDFLVDSGVPWGTQKSPPRETKCDKFRGEKKDEKTVRKLVASAGDADPGQDSPAGFLNAGFSTPSLHRVPVGGRIVYASRIPPRPLETGGLETWRLCLGRLC